MCRCLNKKPKLLGEVTKELLLRGRESLDGTSTPLVSYFLLRVSFLGASTGGHIAVNAGLCSGSSHALTSLSRNRGSFAQIASSLDFEIAFLSSIAETRS